MTRIHLQRVHVLGLDGVRRAVQKAAEEMAQSHEVESSWEGDVLRFSRAGLTGSLEVSESQVVLNAELGMLMSAFKPRIEEQIQKRFDHYLS
jgi:putative polyhydroxyalkanoate system protein